MSTTQETGYTTKATTPCGRIKTINDLIQEAEIDTNEWLITHAKINKWEAAAKDASTGKLIYEPLFQVKLSLIRHPLSVLQPAQPLSPVETKVAKLKPGKYETALFIPDMQIGYNWNENFTTLIPYHDRQAIDIALNVAKIMQPTYIFLLGDNLDLPSFSKYDKLASHYNTVQAAIEELHYYLWRLRSECPKAQIIYLKGNHDIRIRKQLAQISPEIYNLKRAKDTTPILSMENLLRLQDLSIQTNKTYDDPIWLHNVCVRHGTDIGELKATKYQYSMVQGHCHRSICHSKTTPSPQGERVITVMSPGCLCKLDDSVPGFNREKNWQQGLGFGYFDLVSIHPQEHLQVVPIHKGQIWFNGKPINAKTPEDLAFDVAKSTGVKQFKGGY